MSIDGMNEVETIARVKRQDGEGGLAIVENADEKRTEIVVQGKFRFDIHHHPSSFNNRKEVYDFVREYNSGFDIELIDEDGEIVIEFNDNLI